MRTRTLLIDSQTRGVTPIVHKGYWMPPNDSTHPQKGTWVEGDGSLNWQPAPGVQTVLHTSVMTDDPVRAHRMKYCAQTKENVTFNNVSFFDYSGYDPTNTNQPGRYRWSFQGPWALQVGLCGPNNWWKLPRTVDWSVTWPMSDAALLSAAVQRFHDTNEVDNFTNIRESGQTVQMLRSLGDMWSSALLWMPSRRLLKRGRLVPDWSRAQKLYSGKVRELVKEAPNALANGYLAYSFGVAPLVSDIRTMAKAMKTLKADIEKAGRRSQRRTAHAKISGEFKLNQLESASGYTGPVGTASNYSWRLKLQNEFIGYKIATVAGKDTTHYNTEGFRTLDYMMSRFLSRGPVSAIWEAIPYSFVLDWFVNSSSIIDSLDNTLTGSKRFIQEACISTKTEYKGVATIVQPDNQPTHVVTSNVGGSEWGFVEQTSYHREPVSPALWVGGSGRFGKKQASLLGALLHQRVANLKVR